MSTHQSRQIQIARAFRDLYTPARYKIFYGGRGGAKSWQFAIALLVLGMRRPLRVFCGRELQKSIRDSVHALLKGLIRRYQLQGHYRVFKTYIDSFNGTEIIFDGIRNAISEIKSLESIDICWIEEADKVSDYSWQTLIPTIRKEGSEIWASFNPSALHAPTYQRFVVNPPPEYLRGERYAIIKKVSWRDNPWFTQVLRDEMEQLKERDYEKYMHVWEGEIQRFADGAIYGKQMVKAYADNRIREFAIESIIEVETFFDLGKGDATAIWFMQNVGGEYRFIDYFEQTGWEIADYCKVIKGTHPDVPEADNKRRASYNYGRHHMPHDVEAELLGMPRNRKQQFEDGGVRPIKVVPRIASIDQGIDLTREMLARCWFHSVYCVKGLDALCNYKYERDEERDVNKKTPLHDWSSHGADAIRQCAQGYKPVKDKSRSDQQREIAKQQARYYA